MPDCLGGGGQMPSLAGGIGVEKQGRTRAFLLSRREWSGIEDCQAKAPRQACVEVSRAATASVPGLKWREDSHQGQHPHCCSQEDLCFPTVTCDQLDSVTAVFLFDLGT